MRKVAVLLENQFDEREVVYPIIRLKEAGFEVDIVGTDKDTDYVSKSGLTETSTHSSKEVSADDYVGLVIPGGFSPDYMRRSKDTLKLVEEMDKADKPVAAICHGPWLLASAADIKGKDVTSYPSIKDDVINAGANYVDKEVVVDGNIITSRTPDDLPAFMKALIEKLG